MSSKLQKRRRGSVMGRISGGLETMGLEMTGLKMTARVISTLRLRRRPRNVEATLVLVWLLCVIILAACSGNGSGGAVNVAPAKPPASGTARSGGGGPDAVVAASTPAPGAKLGPQPCPATVSDPTHWDPIVGTQPGVNKVESVTCGNLTGSATLQALVTVRANDVANTLDLYVYDNITAANPTQLFSLSGLYNGDARISPYNTVITAEVDVNSRVNSGKPSSQFTRDLCREFKWSQTAGTLVRVA